MYRQHKQGNRCTVVFLRVSVSCLTVSYKPSSLFQASTYLVRVQALSSTLGDSSVSDPVSFNTSEAGDDKKMVDVYEESSGEARYRERRGRNQ